MRRRNAPDAPFWFLNSGFLFLMSAQEEGKEEGKEEEEKKKKKKEEKKEEKAESHP